MKKRTSHLSRLTEMVSSAVANLPAEEQLKARNPGNTTIEVDPKLCVMNPLHRRLDRAINGPDLDSLVASILAGGQVTPAKGWEEELPDGQGKRYVLVYGARRRAACEKAGLFLKLELIPEPSRLELIRLMYGENSSRKDYSPLERGLEFQSYLDAGEASSANELATLLGEDRSTVIRCLQIAKLPQAVLDAYRDPTKLTLVAGTKIESSLDKPDAKQRVLQTAQEWIEQGREGDPTTALLSAASGHSKPKSATVKLAQGKAVYGQVSGLHQQKGALRIELRRGAPDALRDDLHAVLRKHFPGLDG